MNKSLPAAKRTSTKKIIAITATLALLTLGSLPFLSRILNPQPPLPAEISIQQFQRATADWKGLFRTEPSREDVLMLIAETALKRRQPETAVACFTAIHSSHPRYGKSARLQEAQVLLKLNRAVAAESSFKSFLELASQSAENTDPEQLAVAHRWLAWLMAVQLRFEDRVQWLDLLINSKQADVYDAKQRCFPTLLVWASSLGSTRLREFLKQDPDNPNLLIAQARYDTAEGRPEQAALSLRKLLQQQPKNTRALAALLEALFELNQLDEFSKTLDDAPTHTPDEPWLLTQLRAEHALHKQDYTTAEKFFNIVLQHDPANPACHMGLANCFAGQGRTDNRQQTQQRSLLLARIRVQLSDVTPHNPQAAKQLAADARTLGLQYAANTFLELASRMLPAEHK